MLGTSPMPFSAPLPLFVPSPPDALTSAERLVGGMPLKASVCRRSGAHPFFLHDKLIRLTVPFPDFDRRSTPSPVPVTQDDRYQVRSYRGKKQHRRPSWLYFQEFLQQSPAYMSRPSTMPPPLLSPSKNPRCQLHKFGSMEVAFSVSPITGGC